MRNDINLLAAASILDFFSNRFLSFTNDNAEAAELKFARFSNYPESAFAVLLTGLTRVVEVNSRFLTNLLSLVVPSQQISLSVIL